mgnify:CR=1 FL=1
MNDLPHDSIDDSALQAVTAVDLARKLSTWLFVGAAIALAAGLIGSVGTWQAYGNATMAMSDNWMVLSQATSTLSSSLLPAGLLAAAGAALRLQATRVELGS